MITKESPASAAFDALADTIEAMGVTLGAGLPDDWVAPLMNRLEQRITFVRVAREPEAIGIASGAFFGGVKSVAVMGRTGFLACICELATLNLKHNVPLFMILSERGSIDDGQVFQEIQGRVTIPVCQALGIPTLVIDSVSDLEKLPAAFNSSRLQKRPYVVFLSRAFCEGRQKPWEVAP
jgi:sulfopyruvate decarboxylase TPP-binding subunit